MGNCLDASSENNDTHQFSKLETPKEKIVKTILLGTSECGKTTIIKQLKKIHDIYDEEDSKNMINYIRDAVIENMKILCDQSIILNKHYNLNTNVHRRIEYLRDEILSLHPSSNSLSNDVAFKIKELWKDSGIKATLKQRHHFQTDDNISHFFNKVNEIANENYNPSFEDYLLIKCRSIGYCSTRFANFVNNFGEYQFEIPDIGGTRSERRKWWSPKLLLDNNVKAIVYVVPLSDYDLKLYEDNATNRLLESIDLFTQTMIKGNFFRDKKILLLFNKYDLFVQKIKETPITVCFDDFDQNEMNPNDAADAMKFIAGKFLDVFHSNNVDLRKPLRILRTSAIDTESIRDTFYKIVPEIVHQAGFI